MRLIYSSDFYSKVRQRPALIGHSRLISFKTGEEQQVLRCQPHRAEVSVETRKARQVGKARVMLLNLSSDTGPLFTAVSQRESTKDNRGDDKNKHDVCA
ncbi:hypothetical protein SRHO_G00074570 [Serrasalmus rhombeus]